MLKGIFEKLLLLLLIISGSIQAINGQAYQKGWEAFLKNNREEARTSFNHSMTFVGFMK